MKVDIKPEMTQVEVESDKDDDRFDEKEWEQKMEMIFNYPDYKDITVKFGFENKAKKYFVYRDVKGGFLVSDMITGLTAPQVFDGLPSIRKAEPLFLYLFSVQRLTKASKARAKVLSYWRKHYTAEELQDLQNDLQDD